MMSTRNLKRAPLLAAVTILLMLTTTGCGDDDEPTDQDRILDLATTESWVLPELSGPVQVIRTEGNVPHIYARNRSDLAFVQGFVMARDRFFMMDLARRLGLGTIASLLGDAALDIDQESRGSGITFLADQIVANLSPELETILDAFAGGVNAYIERVKTDEVQAPSELLLAQGLLGVSNPIELMVPFDRRAVAAMVAVILYQTSYESGDVGRAATAAKLDSLYEGAALEALRKAGAIEDLWKAIEPIKPYPSAAGFGLETKSGKAPKGFASSGGKPVPQSLLQRLAARLDKQQIRLGRDGDAGFGSNAWAVAGSVSKSGAGILAGDGHLSLAVPSILYQLGLDTSVFGGGATHQLGLVIAGFPVMPIGTNGRVAWSQTQLMGDVTDWYREEITLDSQGRPKTSKFEGSLEDLVVKSEEYIIADVPLLESVGRTEKWDRYETFDGRWIADIEGRKATPDEMLAPGEALLNLQGDYIVPGDQDDDGVITAISFDYGGFDSGALLSTTDALGHADDVHDFREATRGLVAYSQNFAVADSAGSILYTSYQALPCRGYLERDKDGGFAAGADPNLLLDGNKYGAFHIPIKDGIVDETPGQKDPYACVVPFADMPQALDPPAGFVATANNDPAGISFDGSLSNDKWYIGGPYDLGFRSDKIATELQKAIDDGAASVTKMAAIQGNIDSVLGALFVEDLLTSIDYAKELGSSPSDEADKRVAALYQPDSKAIDEVAGRLSDWSARNYKARSGVATFYADPTDEDISDAVATMIFNAWLPRVLQGVFDDEGLPGVFHPGGTYGRIRALHRFLKSRGDNSEGLASHNSATKESAFFDKLGTDEVETSHEIVLAGLVDALAFLRQAPADDDEPGNGGFGTKDMSKWRWGLRHQAKFESLLADFIGSSPEYAALTEQFAITTGHLPLAEDLGSSDPRFGLRWFPRDGDQYAVDAANPGMSGTHFSYGSGPVMRMVVSLKGSEVKGLNIIPGGQSALTDSEYFADQAALWLANKAHPLRFSVVDVVAGAIGREQYTPK